jgi:hypothetical protein
MKNVLVWILVGVFLVFFIRVQRQSHSRPVPPAPVPAYFVSHHQAPTPPKVVRKSLSRRPAPPVPVQTVIVDPKLPPDWYPKTHEEEAARARADASGSLVLVGSLSGTEAKAKLDLRSRIDREVTHWISGDVATGWKPPTEAVDSLIRATYVQPVIEDGSSISKDLDELVTLYRAGAKLDVSPAARVRLVQIHEQQVVHERMIKGGGVLAFVLIGLASLSGYIRADEATKGYYTNRLRLLTAAGVGGAGVLIYQMLA